MMFCSPSGRFHVESEGLVDLRMCSDVMCSDIIWLCAGVVRFFYNIISCSHSDYIPFYNIQRYR